MAGSPGAAAAPKHGEHGGDDSARDGTLFGRARYNMICSCVVVLNTTENARHSVMYNIIEHTAAMRAGLKSFPWVPSRHLTASTAPAIGLASARGFSATQGSMGQGSEIGETPPLSRFGALA